MSMFELIREVAGIPGPTGQEKRVMDWLAERWSGNVEEIKRTSIGNLYAKVGGSGPVHILQAHADEIGFVVRSIDDDGFLHVATAQVADPLAKRYPVGHPVLVLGREADVPGIIATASGHVQTPDQWKKDRLDYEDIFVDIGATSREQVLEQGIHVGARVIWNTKLERLGTRMYGKALDDRMPLALMTLLLEQLDKSALNCELWFAATIQEENGLIGAQAMHTDLKADAVIAIDVGLAGDIPQVEDKTMPTKLGGGPILVHKDATVHYSRDLLWQLADIADREGIPYQHAIFENYGSDGAQFIRHGMPAVLLAPPTRYTHSAFEMVEEADLEATLRLLKAFVTG
jgi:tetrahedral aminopeptidase